MAGNSALRKLSAKYKSDFAFPTVKDRMPVILTKVIDTVYRMKNDIHDQTSLEELKSINGALSRLRNELQTNKPLSTLQDSHDDIDVWNEYLEVDTKDVEEGSSWYKSAWLYVECYFYRRIMSAILQSKTLNHIDPFRTQKQKAFTDSLDAIVSLCSHLSTVDDNVSQADPLRQAQLFQEFFKVSLWGNKCDLSISAGFENSQKDCAVAQLKHLDDFVLCDQSQLVWDRIMDIKKTKPGAAQLDIVLDNAGFELFTDLCLAEFLLDLGVFKRVHFHGKQLPWFVSDVTVHDFNWTLEQMAQEKDNYLKSLGEKWMKRLKDGSWKYDAHNFWTYPQEFCHMKTVAPDLYLELSHSDLILLKGDLNYRKLTGDLTWSPTASFEDALRGFHPAPLCTLRTLKCDLVVGLREGLAEEIQQKSQDWMINGNYAVMQFSKKVVNI